MPHTQNEKENSGKTDYAGSMRKLIDEHASGLTFAAEILKIAEEGEDDELATGIEKVNRYYDDELEFHLQHEEQTILSPLIQSHPEHTPLCITIGKEHGYIRSLVEEMNVATARKNLADFGHILTKHTLLENEELFPVIEKLFTEEQINAIACFAPFKRKPVSDTQSPAGNHQSSPGNQEWLSDVEEFFNGPGRAGGSIVLFPRFDPELIKEMAQKTGLELFNYQREIMEGLGTDADSISLEQLGNSLRNRAERSGIISHNVEALLCVKSEQDRCAWLQAFLDADWPNPILLPITIFQADVPNEHHKVCDLELHKMPRVKSADPITNKSAKYHIEDKH